MFFIIARIVREVAKPVVTEPLLPYPSIGTYGLFVARYGADGDRSRPIKYVHRTYENGDLKSNHHSTVALLTVSVAPWKTGCAVLAGCR